MLGAQARLGTAGADLFNAKSFAGNQGKAQGSAQDLAATFTKRAIQMERRQNGEGAARVIEHLARILGSRSGYQMERIGLDG